MTEPFVFQFCRGESGRPEQMYLADIHAECGVCGQLQVQRYYHSTEVHPVTTAVLKEIARTVALKTAFECPNCGVEVGPINALSTAFTWAFADDAGLIRAFVPTAQDPSSLRWQLVSGRRLDPQELPVWDPDPAEPIWSVLTEDRVEEVLGRCVSVKAVIREVLADWATDPSGGAIASLGGGMTLVAAGPDISLNELAADLDEHLVGIDLDECVPVGLPTHREPAELPGRLQGWLPGEIALDRLRIYLDPEVTQQTLIRAFELANLTFERDADGFSEITTPRDAVYPRPLPLLAVLRRAVYTGLTPGEAARLTAEEIVGTLLRVW